MAEIGRAWWGQCDAELTRTRKQGGLSVAAQRPEDKCRTCGNPGPKVRFCTWVSSAKCQILYLRCA